MNIWYEPVFDVLYEHSYYSDGFSGDLIAVPTSETLVVMRNLGLLVKPLSSGFRVFCKLDTRASNDTTFYAAIRWETPFALRFRLEQGNVWFDNFTDLPINRAPRQFYYFSNRVQVSGATANNLLLGEAESVDGKVGAGDLVTAAGHSASWSFEVPPVQTDTKITWQNTDLEQTFSKNEQNRVQVHFEKLHTIPNGRYRVLTDPVTPAGNRIFYKDPAIAAQIPFGLVEIFSHPAHDDYRFRQEEAVNVGGQIETLTRLSPKVYRVRFERRSMPWQFYVVRRNSTPPDVANLEVFYDDPIQQLPYPQSVTFLEQAVPGEPLRRLFLSSLPLPFFQTPKKDIKLRHKPDTLDIEPLVNLPNPPVSAVRRNDTGDFYAESVIYF